MAIQPKARQLMKHTMSVAKRQTPPLVNRSNKHIFVEITPLAERLQPRFGGHGWRGWHVPTWW